MTSTLRSLLRFWFTFEVPVSRASYLRHGAALMAAKYTGDVLLVVTATGGWWTPVDYLRSVPFLMATTFDGAAPFLAPALALWTLPFMWIGITMTMRRLMDAGGSAWLSLLFFVPLLNYGLMVVLSALPTSPGARARVLPRREEPRLPSALLSMGIGTALGLGMLAVSTRWLNSYGLALFLGTPFGIGVITAYYLCRRYPASRRETGEVVAMTILLVGGVTFLLGTEGAICLLMMVPLGLILALLGGLLGRAIARQSTTRSLPAMVIVVLLPGGAALESGGHAAALREVSTAIEVDAPPSVVWEQVVTFPPIPEPETLLFRLGLAYPKHAEIVGEGVGATRYCVFSTGAFVEPITTWVPGRRLSFGVEASPPPLKELTPFADVEPPHLEGYLVPRRGEFRLVPLADGRTRLEGSTWYEQRLRPEGYWVLFSDRIIRAIHRRVLDHVKRQAELAESPVVQEIPE